MKLGEAILERDGLEERLQLLGSRITPFLKDMRSLQPLFKEIERTTQIQRDLEIAILWTEHQASLSGLSLAAHRIRIDHQRSLAKTLELGFEYEKADDLWKEAQHNHKVIQAASWLVDLQIPPLGTNEEPEAKEGEA
jgi:hypothetical protein